MILVAGGTGFTGRAVVRALRDRGHRVRVLSRGTANPWPEDAGVEIAQGDVRNRETLDGPMTGVSCVIAAVQFPGHPVEVKSKGLTYDEYDRKGIENLVAAADAAGVTRFIYVSGAGVGEGRREEWFVAKDRAENAVRASGIEWVIVRPSWMYGPGDKALNKWVAIAKFSPVLPLTSMGGNTVQPVHVEDVADVIARSVDKPDTTCQVIGVAGPQTLTMKQIVRTLLKVMGKKRLVLPTPPALVKVGAFFLYRLPGRILSPRAVDFANAQSDVDISAMRELVGVEPRPLEQGLAYVRA